MILYFCYSIVRTLRWETRNSIRLSPWLYDFSTRAQYLAAGIKARTMTDPLTSCLVSQPGVVIFLHLLGADSNGHAFRPHSNEYLHNVRVLDAGVRRTEQLLEVCGASPNPKQTVSGMTALLCSSHRPGWRSLF
jgi:hypothetical protein